ncbi:hypothetical protein [Bdellovibrio reynosensis]|uniref:Tetratricopeptide repeat protein n=1 Tax=Bdellovibrio reynosensis TaxID=2835041 RepID=A0ABY4CES0_9BACT|nr:hypothetical protein [Bdellovibrio reynosensis]UOF02954.1 hypothetical protein MNR06_08325 [Bdellovibrio reynosensis]
MTAFRLFVFFYLSLFLMGCSTRQIIRDSEYRDAEAAYRSGDISQALERFPKKEKKGYITSLEKAWLGLWTGEADNKDLLRQSRTFDERKFTSILRETEYFFYSEAEDGYIPAEHEVIVMHLINATYFMRQKKWAQASVETRKATFFLQNYFREDQSHFDDPALRLWLAGIYAALGEWNEAQVDLRKVYQLTKNKEALRLSELSRAPDNITLIFDGSGPTLRWYEGNATPEFLNRTQTPKTELHFSTLPWFERHQQRNTAIRNVVMKSNYMAQYYGLKGSVGAEKSAGFVASNTIRGVGIAAGVVIIGGGLYLLAQSGASGAGEAAGYIIGTGLLAGETLWEKGDEVSKAFTESAEENKTRGLENLKTYRFVRFLPSWISFMDSGIPETANTKGFVIKSPQGKTAVQFLQRF